MTVSGFTIEHNWCANKAASNSSPPPGSPPWCGNTRARADGVNLCFLQYSMHPNSMSPPNNTDESGAPVTRIAALSEFEVKRLPPRSLPPTPPSAMEAGGYSTSICGLERNSPGRLHREMATADSLVEKIVHSGCLQLIHQLFAGREFPVLRLADNEMVLDSDRTLAVDDGGSSAISIAWTRRAADHHEWRFVRKPFMLS